MMQDELLAMDLPPPAVQEKAPSQSPDNLQSSLQQPPVVVSDDDDEEVAGDLNIVANETNSVVESDSDWDEDDDDVDDPACDNSNNGGGALSAQNLEDWLFSDQKEEEAVVSEDDVAMNLSMEVLQDDPHSHTPIVQLETKEPSSKEEANGIVVEDALNLIKNLDQQKVAKKKKNTEINEPPPALSEKEFFQPSAETQVAQRKLEETRTAKELELEALRTRGDHQHFEPTPEVQVAQRKMQETRTSKELELEALRNQGLAGRKSKQLKKTINQNIKAQMALDKQQGKMEWKKVGKGDDDEIEIGTMTTNSTIAATPQLVLPTSPSAIEQVHSPSMAYEQLALEQQKERLRQKQVEEEIKIQNQLHPESQRKADVKLLEMDFVFGLLVGLEDKAPDMKMATKAASKIVPNMLTSKKTIYYDPRYPPKVAMIELDESYGTEDGKPKQQRYMVRGKVPVLPRKRSSKSRGSHKIPESPTGAGTTNATVSTQPLTPLTVGESPSNSVSSNEQAAAASKRKEDLELPSMQVEAPPSNSSGLEETPKEEAVVAQEQPEDDEADDETEGLLEGPLNTSTEEIMSPIRPTTKPTLVMGVDTRSSSTDIQSIRLSKDQELNAIRQRGVARKKNAGFEELQAASAASHAAYKAEQEDLAKRKSAASKFEFQAGKTVNPHDQLYLQQTKQNKSYRKIQQETMDQYHARTTTSPSGALVAGSDDGVVYQPEDASSSSSNGPSDEEQVVVAAAATEPIMEPPSLSAKDSASRTSRYNKLLQKIRPKSKKFTGDEEFGSMEEDDALPKEEQDDEQEEMEVQEKDAPKESVNPAPEVVDVKSSELKLEELRKAKQAELERLRAQEKQATVSSQDVKSSELKFQELRKSKTSELEAIRSRGVAKQKNAGFEQLQAASAANLAAYQAEQEDLAKRKSASSKFEFQAGKIVNPHDQLYLQQNKQNKSYRKIQQETLEEYHHTSPKTAAVENTEEGVVETKDQEDATSVPSDEGETATPSSTEPVPTEPPSPSTNDQAKRQSGYKQLFSKIRPKSKKSQGGEANDAVKETSAESETTNMENVKSSEVKLEELRKAKQAELQALQEKERMTEKDIKSSEVKFEQLRKSKQNELEALRQRGLQHQTSDGKIRMASSAPAAAAAAQQPIQVQQATTPSRPSSSSGGDGVIGFGMVLKKSPDRPSGDLGLNPPGFIPNHDPSTSQQQQPWRAIDDASPSRLKHSTLKNREAEELARLRQQGLAKRGSQQYAVFEQTSREAQKEYEAAAQDLARRKSKTSEYVFQGTKEVSPVDALYMDHQQWRKDIVKEEKEALGIFDEAPEHVDQDDVEGQIPVSNAKFKNTNGYQKWESGDRPVGDKKKKKKKLGGVTSSCGCTIM